MILGSIFVCVWAAAVAAQSTTDAHFIGWYIQPDMSEFLQILDHHTVY